MVTHLTARSSGVKEHNAENTVLRLPRRLREKDRLELVRTALLEIPGVRDVSVNLTYGNISVSHDADLPIFQLIEGALSEQAIDVLQALNDVEAQEPKGIKGALWRAKEFFSNLGNKCPAKCPTERIGGKSVNKKQREQHHAGINPANFLP